MKKTFVKIFVVVFVIIIFFLMYSFLGITISQDKFESNSQKKIVFASLLNNEFIYNGKVQKPKVVIKDSEGNVLIEDKDYIVNYLKSNSKYVGEYIVNIKYLDCYIGKDILTYKIIPVETSIIRLTSNTKGFTINWEKQKSQISGYQIKYYISNDKTNAIKIRIKNKKINSKRIRKLKEDTNYCVKIRTYRITKEGIIYSKWSSVCEIKTLRPGTVYLTFDDGPNNKTTPKVLDILKKYNIKATFFILNYNSNDEKIIKREYNEGHTIAIHGYSHDYRKIYKSEKAFMNNIIKLQKKIKKTTGYTSKIIRFPGGSSNTISSFNPGIMTKLSKLVLKKGFIYFDWNVSSDDAAGAMTKKQIYKNVVKDLDKESQNVVLMHDFVNNSKMIKALPRIIEYCNKHGYIFKNITEETPMIRHGIYN